MNYAKNWHYHCIETHSFFIVQSTMDGEDDLIEELKRHERAIAQRDEIIEEQDKTIEKQKRLIAELRARLGIAE